MPVIATLGALTYNKIPLSPDIQYWLMVAGTSSLPNVEFLGIIRHKNALYIIGRGYVYKISEDFNPILAAGAGGSADYSAITIDNLNNLVVAGSISQTGLLVNINSNASASSAYSWPGAVSSAYRFLLDILYDNTGHYYVTGVTYEGTTPRWVLFISKISVATNTIIWSKYAYLAGAIYQPTAPSPLYPVNLRFDNAGNILVCYSQIVSGNSINYLPKVLSFTPAGTLNYQKYVLGGGVASSMEVDSSGNIYILLRSGVLLKYDSSFNLIWEKQLKTSSTNLVFNPISRTERPINIYNNNLYITLKSGTPSAVSIFKMDFNGNIIWGNNLNYYASPGIMETRFYVFDASFSNDAIYITFQATTYNGYAIKLPIDGSIPGTGNYSVSGTQYITYTYGNINAPASTTISSPAGNLTIVTSTASSINSTSNPTGNGAPSYTVITL